VAKASQIYERGRTPITKNIRVIDAAGNEYEATYPKRAKGLVKNGRARFIDENTLCLACPRNEYLEDKLMNNVNSNEVQSTVENIKMPEGASAEMSTQWVMAKMDAIVHENAYLTDAVKTLSEMTVSGHDSKAMALATVVESREETNRQTIKLLEKMYDSLNPPQTDPASRLNNVDINALADYLESEHMVEIVKAIFHTA